MGDLEGIMVRDVRERQLLYDFTNMWNLKNKISKSETNSYIQRISLYKGEAAREGS